MNEKNDPTNKVFLASARPGDPAALCPCGCGVFHQVEGSWICAECDRPRTTPESVRALDAMRLPTLVWRCYCGSVTWRVSMAGLECTNCEGEHSFDAVFAAGKPPG